MALGKKLILLGCYAIAASALLLVGIAALAIVSLVDSGKAVCVPGLSIRCHESDCGRFYQRCGSTALREVPAHKVCYRGALVSAAERPDLHSCRPFIANLPHYQNLSSELQQQQQKLPEGESGACNCNTFAWPCSCKCLCQNGSGGSVLCKNPLRTYPSDAVARCCLKSSYSGAKCSAARKPGLWTMALETVRQQFSELMLFGQWSLKDAATAAFTFRTPLSASATACGCSVGGKCGALC